MTKVTIQRDICVNLMVPLTATHNFIPLPPVPPVPPPLPAAPLSLAACAIESICNAWWPPGYALGSNKFTTSVFHRRAAICLEGHDCGKFIPHLQVAPAPNNMLTLVHIPLSSRKANFMSTKVRMNAKYVACMTAIAWPPTPMTYCAEPISMPLADAPTSHLNSVVVGMSLADWIMGAVVVAAGMLIDRYFYNKGGGAAAFMTKAATATVEKMVVAKLVGQLWPTSWASWALKQGVGVAAGITRMLVTGEGGGAVTLTVGGPFLGGTVTVGVSQTGGTTTVSGGGTINAGTMTGTGTVANKDGTTTASGGITARHPAGLGERNLTGSTDKGVVHTDTQVNDPFNGFHNRQVKTNPDGSQTVADNRAP